MTAMRTTTHPLTGPTSLEDFMGVLEQRRAAWIAENGRTRMPPLMSWFYMPEDDAWIIPPQPSDMAPAAPKPRRGPEYHQALLDAAEARLAKARAKHDQAQARANNAGIPNDPGAHSGITRSTRAGRKHAQRIDNQLAAASNTERQVKRLEHTVAHHRANLNRAIERNQA